MEHSMDMNEFRKLKRLYLITKNVELDKILLWLFSFKFMKYWAESRIFSFWRPNISVGQTSRVRFHIHSWVRFLPSKCLTILDRTSQCGQSNQLPKFAGFQDVRNTLDVRDIRHVRHCSKIFQNSIPAVATTKILFWFIYFVFMYELFWFQNKIIFSIPCVRDQCWCTVCNNWPAAPINWRNSLNEFKTSENRFIDSLRIPFPDFDINNCFTTAISNAAKL